MASTAALSRPGRQGRRRPGSVIIIIITTTMTTIAECSAVQSVIGWPRAAGTLVRFVDGRQRQLLTHCRRLRMSAIISHSMASARGSNRDLFDVELGWWMNHRRLHHAWHGGTMFKSLGIGLAVAACAIPTVTSASAAVGRWLGQLDGADGRRVAVSIGKTSGSAYRGTVTRTGQAEDAVPLQTIEASPDRLAFSAPGVRFEGRWNAVAGQWQGTWTEAGVSAPLSLRWNTDLACKNLPCF
jgi:hypothetical protein